MIIAILLVLYVLLRIFKPKSNQDMIFGVSFSAEHARYLGLDPVKNLDKILNDWNFKYLRLSAYWNRIEKQQGKYDFTDLDWQMATAKKSGAKVMLAVGQKIPRWPECHLPEWTSSLKKEEYNTALLNFITAVVNRYKDNPALEIWQVENEPYLPFGICPPRDTKTLKEEIALVKELDKNHETITTDSGELSLWMRAARKADLFGVTMYRVVWNRFTGYWRYNWLPPSYYSLRARLHGLSASKVFITELQAEPWIPHGTILDTSIEEQYKSMDVKQLEENLQAARDTGFARAYLWGAEWWYWQEGKGYAEFSNFIKNLKK